MKEYTTNSFANPYSPFTNYERYRSSFALHLTRFEHPLSI